MPASAGISFFKSSPKGELSYKVKIREILKYINLHLGHTLS